MAEPHLRGGAALLRQEDVPGGGEGAAPAEAGERAAAGGRARPQKRPGPGQREGKAPPLPPAAVASYRREHLPAADPQVHQLDATILSLGKHKQAGQASALKALEQENAALKRELQAQREQVWRRVHVQTWKSWIWTSLKISTCFQGCEAARSGAERENLQLENEALKAQMSRLSSQLLEVLQKAS